MTSIRKRLLLNLVLLFTTAWMGLAAATYFEARHEIEELFDAQLAQAAGVVTELVLANLDSSAGASTRLAREVYGHHYERKISFQIWEGDQLLVRSKSAPTARLSPSMGFTDERIGNERWRVFAMHSEDRRHEVYVAEGYAVRDELVNDITHNALYPLLVALPVVALLIWYSIGRGLAPLQRLATEVSRRTPQQLKPIEASAAPDEVQPLTDSLNSLLLRLQDAFARETRFTADAAHELRTPLASIKAQAQVALRAVDDDERRASLHKIVEGVDHSSHLLEQMLTLARLEPEAYRKELEPVDLAPIAEAVVGELAPYALDKGVTIGLDARCTPAAPCVVRGYATALGILLRNLIDNAVRYSPAGSEVEVILEATPADVELIVRDTGPGIPEHLRERVFDPFFRQRNDDRGCGLGLSIVQRIARLHNGDVQLQNMPEGGGLRVSVRLPATEGNPRTLPRK